MNPCLPHSLLLHMRPINNLSVTDQSRPRQQQRAMVPAGPAGDLDNYICGEIEHERGWLLLHLQAVLIAIVDEVNNTKRKHETTSRSVSISGIPD